MWFPYELLLFLSFLEISLTTTPKGATSTTSSTCPSRTVNYITHSLPQQCLASSRSVNVTSSTVGPALVPSRDSATIIPAIIETHGSTSFSSPSPTEPTVSVADPTTTEQDVEGTAAAPSTSDPSQTSQSPSPQAAADESPLEEGNFLSFEDWKRENLRKAGQSEHVGSAHAGEPREIKKRPTLDHDSLDSLGDDAEIDLDFSGFVSDNVETPHERQKSSASVMRESPIAVEPGRAPRAGVRSKDAGTTCKERFNYASYDCAATILKTNPEAKGASAVLGKNKDSYMLNECSAQNKFLILELCDDISIDTIVLANFEFFSSTFRTFRVSVSDKYPVKVNKWKVLGTFEARNTRDVQAFLVENPVIWARYLRIEFLSHYGNEYYCPVSLVRVHGTTMLEEYKHDLESVQSDNEDVERQESDETSDTDSLVPEAVAEAILTQAEHVKFEEPVGTHQLAEIAESTATETGPDPANATQIVSVDAVVTPMPTSPANLSVRFDERSIHEEMLQTCETVNESTTATEGSSGRQQSSVPITSTEEESSKSTVSSAALTTDKTSVSAAQSDNATTTASSSHASVPSSDTGTNSTAIKSPPSSSIANATKVSASSAQPPAATPTMQESFFKSVQKRLQMLESNSSLSLQYIEEQSRALRDAFLKVEQRQMAKTTSFLDYLNTTVLNELRDFRQQYDQLWQSTVIELEMQRERYQQESMAINARLGILADEVIFQKRMSLLQMLLILICLGLVLFSKGSLNSYLEMPLVQSVLARSPSSRWLSISGLDTPSHSPSSSRANSTREARRRQGILKSHRHMPSEDTGDEAVSPSELYSPPTPVSIGEPSDDGRDSSLYDDPQFDPSMIERPSTSPPVLLGTESPETPRDVPEFEDDSIDARLMGSPPRSLERKPPMLVVEEATPPSKHLSWKLPDV